MGTLLFVASDLKTGKHVPIELFGPINNQDLAFAAFGFAALLADPGILRRLLTWKLVWYGCLVGALTFVGFGSGNERRLVLHDLRIWAWPVIGVAVFYTLQRNGRLVSGLVLIAGLVAVALVRVARANQGGANLEIEGGRLVALGLSDNGLLITMLAGIIVLRAIWSSLWGVLWAFGLVAIMLYCTAILGANRSDALSVGAMLAALCGSLFRLATLLRDFPSVRRRALTVLSTLVAGGAALVVFLAISSAGKQLNVIKRFDLAHGAATLGDERLDEASVMIGSLSPTEWAFGRGFGGTFPSVVPGYIPEATHIGILTFALKGGAPLLGAAVLIILIVLPLSFIYALVRPASSVTAWSYGILNIWPALAGWTVLICISGGYYVYSAFGIGICMACFTLARPAPAGGAMAIVNGSRAGGAAGTQRGFGRPGRQPMLAMTLQGKGLSTP